MLAEEDALIIGRVVAAYGIKGWVKVHSFTDPKDNIFSYQPWYLRSPTGWQQVKVTSWRIQGKSLVACIDGCADRTLAESSLLGRDIAMPRSALPAPQAGEYYWRDLIGLRVSLADGRVLGVIRQMLETGANDVMVVQGDSESIDRQERLIPWLPDRVVGKVDLVAGTVEVDWDPEF
ncbi:ribosome maturation factor RimM [Alcanivorax sp. JB21]|uniref:ribosome maturation factor RimM n=1 Tax=Alcanivorax limicola TaxID=2874102 RepID=UPI001CC0B8CC|nr:ribosome maturation factor RimM [Alcanivorax limicola]MBZ2189565.1 ribosome maturation factor RimM [Alcanivorax limicola]